MVNLSDGGLEYLSLLESAPVAMIVSDADGRITFANLEAESLFGCARNELIGRPIESLVPEALRGRHAEHRKSYFAKPESRSMGSGLELFALHRTGARIPVEIGLRPVETRDGVFVLSTIVDVTKRMHSEKATARLAAIVKFSHVAMIAFTPEGIVTDWNPAAEQLYEYSAEEMIGKSVLCLTPPELQAQSRALIQRIMRGDTVDYLETERVRKSGSRVRISLTASPIEAPDGQIVGISSIARDITQRVELEGKLRRANDELAEQARQLKETNLALERSNLELQQFAYVASHDLQAPLRSINGFLQFLRDEYASRLDAQGLDWIQRALDSVVRLQTLIKDLLSYARVESRGQPFKPVDLCELFDDTKRLLTASISETMASVTRDELPTIKGDATQLGRVFENLIENALKYRASPAPMIHVAVSEEADSWHFAVRDNGIGIDPQFHEQIFEIFRRLHTERDYPGTGIGLAICRRVINRHGGQLWVESAEGQGSTFRFTLPKG